MKKETEDVNKKQEDDLEFIDVTEEGKTTETEENNEKPAKKGKMTIQLALLIVIILIVVVVFWRLKIWNGKTVTVDTDVEKDEYLMECQDYYIYPDEENLKDHEDDGVTKILVIGNYFLNAEADGKSVLSILEDGMDAEFITLIADDSCITSESGKELEPSAVRDNFSLYRVVDALVNKNNLVGIMNAALNYGDGIFFSDWENRSLEYWNTIQTLDLNDIDRVVIAYSLTDYYGSMSPYIEADEDEIVHYFGALYSSITMLQNAYPHLDIIFASPVPEYTLDENGDVQLSNFVNYGKGNSSYYVDFAYYAVTKACVSYIDNYFYVINDSNITEYLDGMNLNAKGVELVGNHMLDFLVNGVAN